MEKNTKERQTTITLFKFENQPVRTVLINGSPWFVAKDVCGLLELTNHRKTVGDLPESERFKTWVFSEVLPRIRRGEGAGGASDVYSLFSDCHDMTINRMNKLIYYFSLTPPLANADISRLMEVSDSTVTYWRKRLTAEKAREAVARLGIDARGHSANVPSHTLPAKEAQYELR